MSVAYDLAHTQDGNNRCLEYFKLQMQNSFRSVGKLKEIKVFRAEQRMPEYPSNICFIAISVFIVALV